MGLTWDLQGNYMGLASQMKTDTTLGYTNQSRKLMRYLRGIYKNLLQLDELQRIINVDSQSENIVTIVLKMQYGELFLKKKCDWHNIFWGNFSLFQKKMFIFAKSYQNNNN